MTDKLPSDRVRLRRLHQRGAYDQETIRAILDAGTLCHVGYSIGGHPYVTPTMYWREDNDVYWHGSSASRMLRASVGEKVCFTVTHMDGFVLARSGFHHSANFRSVMAFGTAEKVEDDNEKVRQMEIFMERLFPGRWAELRPVTAQEMKATTVLKLPLDEASAKIRSGPPQDDEEDYALSIWAGVLPIAPPATLAPQPCSRLREGCEVPANVSGFDFT
jgi:hypothetical protein